MRADRDHHPVVDGVVVAVGAHRELLEAVPAYRSVVTREEDAYEQLP